MPIKRNTPFVTSIDIIDSGKYHWWILKLLGRLMGTKIFIQSRSSPHRLINNVKEKSGNLKLKKPSRYQFNKWTKLTSPVMGQTDIKCCFHRWWIEKDISESQNQVYPDRNMRQTQPEEHYTFQIHQCHEIQSKAEKEKYLTNTMC